MNENIKKENNFVGFEYKDFTVSRRMESVYVDGYQNFGWTLEGITASAKSVFSEVMSFKRDRKIRNKAELTRLQRQFEACVAEIVALERSKVVAASTVAYIVGVVGTAFMAGSVFAYLAAMLPLCIILAVPAFAGWILPYHLYTRLRRKKSEAVTPNIENKYDEIYEVCEKANALLDK